MILKDLILKIDFKDAFDAIVTNYPDTESTPGCKDSLRKDYEKVYEDLKKKKTSLNDKVIFFKKEDADESISVYIVDKGKEWATDFMPFNKYVNMKLSDQVLGQYSEEDIVAHCLFDMTFYGFSEKKVKSKRDELNNRIKKLK